MAKYMAHGSPCERVAWVRLESPVVPQFYIVPYFPHGSRKDPSFLNTLEKVVEVLKQVPKGDCIIIGGDMNITLPSNLPGLTGKWTTEGGTHNKPLVEAFLAMMRV